MKVGKITPVYGTNIYMGYKSMSDMRKYMNLVESKGVDEEWFKSGSFKTYKKPAKEKYRIASEPGTIETLEGPVKYGAGYYIMTGPKGEEYPITPERFRDLKDDLGDGYATPKKIIKMAKIADHSGVVNTSWGEPLKYDPGVDVIVRHGPGDYGVVKLDIFKQTYDTTGMK